ncbi:uncharacterized protein ATNIH1004_011783 [Aspergillus tanneri]|uniref:Uncharacterized protein n=1 Tax=Aspergillus tanneri TaxID=1220188 RepID=A0A5M9MF92_9EURO|nr:uncharacterized protein ATNIH1004_011783 [Aspergillus tanneri]KAA8641647.1 hypothetical protein ATNIH1004_011783 [Aspergillus tanneri]
MILDGEITCNFSNAANFVDIHFTNVKPSDLEQVIILSLESANEETPVIMTTAIMTTAIMTTVIMTTTVLENSDGNFSIRRHLE